MCDSNLAPVVADCCELFGAFVAPGAYLPQARAALGSAAVGSRAHRGALAFLAAALRGAGGLLCGVFCTVSCVMLPYMACSSWHIAWLQLPHENRTAFST